MNLSNEDINRIALHMRGLNDVLMDAVLKYATEQVSPCVGTKPEADEFATGIGWDVISAEYPDAQPLDIAPQRPAIPDYDAIERHKKEKMLGSMCGRWTSGGNRAGIEISRAGEHFILTYLKRNGYPSDERYVLIWLDDDVIYYYGYGDRMTVLALNTQSDTLMISPGRDYTRMDEPKR